MKVEPTDNSAKPEVNHPERSSANASNSPFSAQLRDLELEQRRTVCTGLLCQIDAQSELLKKAPTPDGVKRYRELVVTFMKEAMGQTYQVEQQTRWDKSGNRKCLVVVKKVNDSLEDLMNLVTDPESSQMNLVAKLDQIRGLLLDLYL
jgi:uncharacterized protein YaaR (DUF327 family)